MPELPQTVDYVVVGGGTAGNVVAARLAERGFSVLVVEAGKDESAEPEIRTPVESRSEAPAMCVKD
ncbi:hypothetical protein AAF712_007622 [Marasmius tenuissimus]|uniref:Choline dehydrogenase n=1 Tax=Marasmius tenuissimus TaxID=585030 RepID=A0ABR2ZVM7_9AGAR